MASRKSVRPRSKRPTATKPKLAVMDTLVQSSTVAVFHACGVAVAPLEPVHLEYDDIALEFPVGAMAFRAPGLDAALVLSLPKAVNARLEIWRRSDQDPRDVGLPSLRGGHDRRPDPLGAPPGVGHARLRHLMTVALFRHDRRPRRRGRPRLRSGVPRSRRASPSQRASSPYAPPSDEGRRRSRADDPLIDHWPRTGIPLRAP